MWGPPLLFTRSRFHVHYLLTHLHQLSHVSGGSKNLPELENPP